MKFLELGVTSLFSDLSLIYATGLNSFSAVNRLFPALSFDSTGDLSESVAGEPGEPVLIRLPGVPLNRAF